jgi:hypothetical protein
MSIARRSVVVAAGAVVGVLGLTMALEAAGQRNPPERPIDRTQPTLIETVGRDQVERETTPRWPRPVLRIWQDFGRCRLRFGTPGDDGVC